MMQKKKSLLLLGLLILLSSCQYSLPDEMPDLGINVEELELNQHIQVTAPKELNTYETGNYIDLELSNISDTSWDFNIEQDVLIYQYEDNDWKEVSNKMLYFGRTDFTLAPRGQFPSDVIYVGLYPDIERGKSTSLRIFIMVHKQDHQTKAAFVDVGLKPKR